MADFSIQNIFSKISEYDKQTKDNADIEALVEYKILGQKDTTETNLPQDDIIDSCTVIKNYLTKILH